MSEFITISVLIGDRNYRIKVEPGHEETVRKTAKYLNEKIAEFKQSFAGKDMQDFIAMVLLWFATERAEDVKKRMLDKEVEASLLRLNNMVDKGLQAMQGE